MSKKLILKRNYWKEEEENLLKQWADKAKCYQWLHNKSREIYQRKNAWFTIPVIIISTIVGTANFAQDRFSDDIRPYIVISIGTLSLIAGIITTVYQFLKISEINEAHRTSLLSWGKFHVNIESELSRHPLDRIEPSELIKISKDEFNRLLEISPFIPKKVLNEFNSKFKDCADLIKPEIGNNINPMKLFQMNNENRQIMIENLNKDILIQNKELIKKKQTKNDKINKFRQSFFDLNNRYPNKEEIRKNLKYTNIENNYSDDDSDDSNFNNKVNITNIMNQKSYLETDIDQEYSNNLKNQNDSPNMMINIDYDNKSNETESKKSNDSEKDSESEIEDNKSENIDNTDSVTIDVEKNKFTHSSKV